MANYNNCKDGSSLVSGQLFFFPLLFVLLNKRAKCHPALSSPLYSPTLPPMYPRLPAPNGACRSRAVTRLIIRFMYSSTISSTSVYVHLVKVGRTSPIGWDLSHSFSPCHWHVISPSVLHLRARSGSSRLLSMEWASFIIQQCTCCRNAEVVSQCK